jgi:hypothetical protein
MAKIIDARAKRQAMLTSPDAPAIHAIIDEAVLRRVVGSPEVMRAQLDKIRECANYPSVIVQVLPFSCGAHPGLDGAFILLEFAARSLNDVVYVEGLLGEFFVERDADLRRYRDAFELLIELALGQDESLDYLDKVAAAMPV